MPIGFWAISRADLVELIAFHMEDYHKPKSKAPSMNRISHLARDISIGLDELVKNEIVDFVRFL